MNIIIFLMVFSIGYSGYVFGYLYGWNDCDKQHKGHYPMQKFKWLWHLLFILGAVVGFFLSKTAFSAEDGRPIIPRIQEDGNTLLASKECAYGIVLAEGQIDKATLLFNAEAEKVVTVLKQNPDFQLYLNKKFKSQPYVFFSTKFTKDRFILSMAFKRPTNKEFLDAGSYTWMDAEDFDFILMGNDAQSLVQFAVARHAVMSMFTKKKCPEWLMQGFPTMIQYSITGKDGIASNLGGRGETQKKKWNVLVKEALQSGKVEPWGIELNRGLNGLSDSSYAIYRSVVTFLYMDPKAFTRFIALMDAGEVLEDGLSKAYGKKPEELQRMWAAWALSQ